MRSKRWQAQRDQVGVGTALVVGFDAGDGFVEPGRGERHGRSSSGRRDCGGVCSATRFSMARYLRREG